MNRKQKQVYVIGIIIIIAYSVTAFYLYPIPRIAELYGKIDPELKHLVTTITVAGLGLILFVARHAKIKPEVLEQIEVWDLAILIIIPSVEAFSYIVGKDPHQWPWAVLAYIVGVMAWFVLVIYRHKTFEDPKEEKKFNFTFTYLMIVFSIYCTYAVWAFITITPYMKPAGT